MNLWNFPPTDPNVPNMVWASGNQDSGLTNGKKGPETYPTFQADNGVVGRCAGLVTRSTGTFGAMVGMPLAAGNLFIGKFDMTNAVNKPLEATQFGTCSIIAYRPAWLLSLCSGENS